MQPHPGWARPPGATHAPGYWLAQRSQRSRRGSLRPGWRRRRCRRPRRGPGTGSGPSGGWPGPGGGQALPPGLAGSVNLFTCTGGANQQWRAVDGTLVNPVSGKCLDDPRFNVTNGTQLKIYTCNGGSNQQWKLP